MPFWPAWDSLYSSTSPAFFRSEVLHKYKADPDKYDLSDRSLSCRGTWHLTTYDVNEANQVHTYLQYLSDLPYQEQLYWCSFNESPKAPISSRAYRTDFQGEFPLQYDHLPAIKAKIEHLDDQSPAWWVHRGEALPQVVHYPVTTSQSEWADAILALDQLVVEGFRATELRRIAISLGATPDKEWQSIKLLEVCLQGVGSSAQEAKEVIQPLRDLHRLRSVIKGHAMLLRLERPTPRTMRSVRTALSMPTSRAWQQLVTAYYRPSLQLWTQPFEYYYS